MHTRTYHISMMESSDSETLAIIVSLVSDAMEDLWFGERQEHFGYYNCFCFTKKIIKTTPLFEWFVVIVRTSICNSSLSNSSISSCTYNRRFEDLRFAASGNKYANNKSEKKTKKNSKSRVDYSIKSAGASHQHLGPLEVGVEELSLEPHERSASLGEMTDFNFWPQKKDKTTPLYLGSGQSTLAASFMTPKHPKSEKSCPKLKNTHNFKKSWPGKSSARPIKMSRSPCSSIIKKFCFKTSFVMTRSQLAPGYSEVGAVKANWLVGATATSEVSSFSIPGFLWSKATASWKSWLVHYVILC